jgi:rare lipoprotein A
MRFLALCATLLLVFAGEARAESGIASVYAVPGRDVYAGRIMACGGKANPNALTAAHKTLPCGSRVRVTNRRNGQSVVVTIRDRGPFIRGRIIDLKPAGSRAIACGDLCPVTLTRM